MKIKDIITFKSPSPDYCIICKKQLIKNTTYYRLEYDEKNIVRRVHKRCAHKNSDVVEYLMIKALEKWRLKIYSNISLGSGIICVVCHRKIEDNSKYLRLESENFTLKQEEIDVIGRAHNECAHKNSDIVECLMIKALEK